MRALRLHGDAGERGEQRAAETHGAAARVDEQVLDVEDARGPAKLEKVA